MQEEARFFKVVKAAFAQRRKVFRNALQGAGISKETVTRMLREAQIDGERRGETLDLQEFAAVAEAWTKTLQEGAAFSEKEK